MKIAIVTGASSGIGREFVRQIGYFYNELDEIWIVARRKERLEELKATSPVFLRSFAGDLSDSVIYEEFLANLLLYHPNIRMLVNAAGFGKNGSVESISKVNFELQPEMIDLNCTALTRMILYCLPYCERGTRIINIASAAAFCPQPGFSVYAATKSYVLSFSKSLSAELKHRGVCVTAVCPGPVRTEFFETAGSVTNPLKEKTMTEASKVVKRALHDSQAGKSVSIYGKAMKFSQIASKLLPHSLIMKLLYENTFQKEDSKKE